MLSHISVFEDINLKKGNFNFEQRWKELFINHVLVCWPSNICPQFSHWKKKYSEKKKLPCKCQVLCTASKTWFSWWGLRFKPEPYITKEKNHWQFCRREKYEWFPCGKNVKVTKVTKVSCGGMLPYWTAMDHNLSYLCCGLFHDKIYRRNVKSLLQHDWHW